MELCAGLLQIGDQVLALSLLLKTGENHLSSGDVLLGVQQIFEKGVLAPGDASVDVGSRVGVVLGLAGGTAEKAVKVGALLVGTSLLNGVACWICKIKQRQQGLQHSGKAKSTYTGRT